MEQLSTLLHLEERARSVGNTAELGFVMVNETVGLVAYRQAACWLTNQGVVALSGIPVTDPNVPMVQWLNRVCRSLHASAAVTRVVDPQQLATLDREEWQEWFPPYGLWLLLPGREGTRLGGILLARETPWQEGELVLLQHLAGAYAHAWLALLQPSPWSWFKRHLAFFSRVKIWLWLGLIGALSVVPVRLTVLAPAEVVPDDPILVRAPLEGVIEKIHVQPNDSVTEGTPLFDLDPTSLASKLEVAEKSLATALAEYRQVSHQAVEDVKSKYLLAIISGRIEERRAETVYLKHVLNRIRVKTPRSGVVIFDDPSAWLGRPVALGEKVMVVTGIHETELEAWVAMGDDIDLPPQAEVTFFPNVNPLQPVTAQVRFMAYEAFPKPNGQLAFRLRATVEANNKPRVGLKGTARIHGEQVPLLYWLFRKPLALVRQGIGW
ncbi:MAG: biotin/lipoyl-binding protein [Magnetococcus sp. DMHC-1]